jgi:hypothetical protein
LDGYNSALVKAKANKGSGGLKGKAKRIGMGSDGALVHDPAQGFDTAKLSHRRDAVIEATAQVDGLILSVLRRVLPRCEP